MAVVNKFQVHKYRQVIIRSHFGCKAIKIQKKPLLSPLLITSNFWVTVSLHLLINHSPICTFAADYSQEPQKHLIEKLASKSK